MARSSFTVRPGFTVWTGPGRVSSCGWGQDEQGRTRRHLVAGPGQDLRDHAARRRVPPGLHLHRLQGEERLAGGHLVTRLDVQLPYGSRELGLDETSARGDRHLGS